jgi:hypothetical protein
MQARLATQTKPPADLPEGHAAFTLYVAPQRAPQGRPVRLDVSLHVPAAVCADEKLSGLALFAYEEGLGWYQPQPQEFDPASRTFHARHDTVGRSYAVLGPVSALLPVPPESAGQAGAVPPGAEALADTGPVGIDVLLQQHALPRPVTGTPRFKLERLDAKKKGGADEVKAPPPAPEAVSEPGRLFKFERQDAPAAKQEKNVPMMPEIPGFRYGPGLKDEFGDSPTPSGDVSGRVFKIDRLDKPQLPQGLGTKPELVESPEMREMPAPAKDAAGPAGDAAPVPAAPQEKAPPPAPDTPPPEKKPAQDAGTRPELPSVIPQDPSFNFGPNFRAPKPDGEDAAAGKHGTFRIERVKP